MPTHQHTVPWLFVVMASLTLLATVAIAALVAAPSYIMLGFAFVAVLAGAGVVLAAIVHELGQADD